MPPNRIQLLLIEDDKVDQMAFDRWMRDECPDFDFTIAGSVAEARTILGSRTFDIVVTDYQLGDGLAFEIFPCVRSAPLILTTASGDENVAVQALKHGAYDYLIKDPDRQYLKLMRFTLERSIERKKAEDQFKLLSEALVTIQDGVCISDESDRIVFVNRAFSKIYGYSEAEALALDWGELRGNGPTGPAPSTLSHGDFWEGEAPHRRKNGETFEVYCSQSVLRMQGQMRTVRVLRDMTERKRLEAAVRQSEKIAAVGQLAAGVAHEINNPLSVILGFAQGAAQHLKPDDPLTTPIRWIQQEAMRCKNLVQDLLTFSHAPKSEFERLDFNRTVEGALSLIQTQASMVKVILERQLAPNLPEVQGNPTQIQQVVINLAKNAIDAMQAGGVITVTTVHLCDSSGSWISLTVADQGCGIPADILPRIFEPFFTTKPVGQGTGLGLGLVHEIVTKHGGNIHVTSRPGHTRFNIRFPAR